MTDPVRGGYQPLSQRFIVKQNDESQLVKAVSRCYQNIMHIPNPLKPVAKALSLFAVSVKNTAPDVSYITDLYAFINAGPTTLFSCPLLGNGQGIDVPVTAGFFGANSLLRIFTLSSNLINASTSYSQALGKDFWKTVYSTESLEIGQLAFFWQFHVLGVINFVKEFIGARGAALSMVPQVRMVILSIMSVFRGAIAYIDLQRVYKYETLIGRVSSQSDKIEALEKLWMVTDAEACSGLRKEDWKKHFSELYTQAIKDKAEKVTGAIKSDLLTFNMDLLDAAFKNPLYQKKIAAVMHVELETLKELDQRALMGLVLSKMEIASSKQKHFLASIAETSSKGAKLAQMIETTLKVRKWGLLLSPNEKKKITEIESILLDALETSKNRFKLQALVVGWSSLLTILGSLTTFIIAPHDFIIQLVMWALSSTLWDVGNAMEYGLSLRGFQVSAQETTGVGRTSWKLSIINGLGVAISCITLALLIAALINPVGFAVLGLATSVAVTAIIYSGLMLVMKILMLHRESRAYLVSVADCVDLTVNQNFAKWISMPIEMERGKMDTFNQLTQEVQVSHDGAKYQRTLSKVHLLSYKNKLKLAQKLGIDIDSLRLQKRTGSRWTPILPAEREAFKQSPAGKTQIEENLNAKFAIFKEKERFLLQYREIKKEELHEHMKLLLTADKLSGG